MSCSLQSIELERTSRRAAKAHAAIVAAASGQHRRELLAFSVVADGSPLDAIEGASPSLEAIFVDLRRAIAEIAAEPSQARRVALSEELEGPTWDLALGYAEAAYQFGVELGRRLPAR